MKILVFQTNTYRFLNPSPIGASLVALSLRRAGHELHFVDLMFEKNPVRTAERETKTLKPDLVCFSIRNRDNMSVEHFFDPMPQIKSVIQSVRNVTLAPTLLGGTAFTTYPRSMLLDTQADYGIAGDDLQSITRFVSSLETGLPDFTTPGLVYRTKEGAVAENPFQIVGYRHVAFHNYQLVDLKKYRRGYWQAGVVTQTGCNEKCAFCDTFHTFGRDTLLREPQQIAKEILALKQTGIVRSIFLINAGFNRPLDHAKAVLEEIIRNGAQLRLNGILDPGQADAEFFRLFRRAGGFLFTLFAESLSDTILESLGKFFRYADIVNNTHLMHQENVPFVFMPTFGSPGETPETVQETFDRIRFIKPLLTDFGIGWRIQPRTPLFDRAVAEGLIDASDDCYHAKFYISPHTPRPWLEQEVKRWKRSHFFGQMRLLPFALKAITHRPWTWTSTIQE